MRGRRWSVGAVAAAGALVVAGAAAGVGPWPGTTASVSAPDGSVRYVAAPSAASTTVAARRVRDGKVLRSATFRGVFAVPQVTSTGLAGGLSPDGRLLVLAEPPTYEGLRTKSRFLLISTASLRLSRAIVLEGEFGFDALSPDARTLYLIQHRSQRNLTSYLVRAYDLRVGRLLARAIVDKRKTDEAMHGYPVARATSADGTWVYTLYRRDDAKPFIHALNAQQRYAMCIDLPWPRGDRNEWSAQLELARDGSKLRVKMPAGVTVATVDTRTLRVLTT